MTPEAYLREHCRRPAPTWLAAFEPGDRFDSDAFFNSRVVFYPGSGVDGHAVKVFGSAHAAHCFVYADYSVPQATVERTLGPAGARFLGYKTLARIALRREDVGPKTWSFHVTPDEIAEMRCRTAVRDPEVYGFLEVLEREPTRDETHGPSRLAILFLGADGHAAYDALFCQTGQQPPFAVLLQDHGFGGNYSNWGADGLAARIAERTDRWPEFLLVDDLSTRPWTGYRKVDELTASVGGEWGNKRVLYRRVA